jgi:hypothetical protein
MHVNMWSFLFDGSIDSQPVVQTLDGSQMIGSIDVRYGGPVLVVMSNVGVSQATRVTVRAQRMFRTWSGIVGRQMKVVGRTYGVEPWQTLTGTFATALSRCAVGETIRWEVDVGRSDSIRTYSTWGVWTVPREGGSLVPNPSFENADGTPLETGWFGWVPGDKEIDYPDAAWGTCWLHWYNPGGGLYQSMFAVLSQNVVAGHTYKLSLWFRKGYGTFDRVSVWVGGYLSNIIAVNFGGTNWDWEELSWEVTMTRGGAETWLIFEDWGGAPLNIGIDGVMFREVFS